jgi:hypothetical protein
VPSHTASTFALLRPNCALAYAGDAAEQLAGRCAIPEDVNLSRQRRRLYIWRAATVVHSFTHYSTSGVFCFVRTSLSSFRAGFIPLLRTCRWARERIISERYDLDVVC